MVGHNGDKMSRTRSIVILCILVAWLGLPMTVIQASGDVTGRFEIQLAPTVTSFVPADEATGVVPDANLVLNFSEAVVKGTGNIVIYKSDNTTFETIAVTDARVSISGSQVTINPDGIFASETVYYVQIEATSFEDTEDTPYAGINDATTWNFTSIYIASQTEEAVASGVTNYTVDASATASTTVTVNTTATVTITILKYAANPHPEIELPANILPGHFIDVMVDNPSAITWPAYVEQTYTDADADAAGIVESSLRMYYYSAGSWNQCSDTGVNTANNTVWARMTESEFTGSPLIIRGTAVTPPVGWGGTLFPEEEEEEVTPPPAPVEEEEEVTPPPAPEEEEEEVTPPPAPEEEEEEVTPPPAPEEEEEVPEALTEPFFLPLIGGLIGAATVIALVIIFRRKLSLVLKILFPRLSGG